MSEATTSISELVSRIREERAIFDALIGRVSDADLSEAAVEGDWTAKDLLAHIIFWEQRTLIALAALQRGEQPPALRHEEEDWARATDRLNAENADAQRDRPLAEVRAAALQSFQQVIEAVEQLSDADLAPDGRLAQILGEPLLGLIAGDTYEHYQEHTQPLRAWLDQRL